MPSIARLDQLDRVARVYASLQAHAESVDNGWGEVYLDNARVDGISAQQFRACLASLSERGQYKVIDGFAWGRVKMDVVS